MGRSPIGVKIRRPADTRPLAFVFVGCWPVRCIAVAAANTRPGVIGPMIAASNAVCTKRLIRHHDGRRAHSGPQGKESRRSWVISSVSVASSKCDSSQLRDASGVWVGGSSVWISDFIRLMASSIRQRRRLAPMMSSAACVSVNEVAASRTQRLRDHRPCQ
jgi:hypothetical protein